MIKRVDENQSDIVSGLRQLGMMVSDTHEVGKGFPDIVVGIHGLNILLEIKNDKMVPSKQKLTPEETIWHKAWKGQIDIVKNIDEAVEVVNREVRKRR